MDEILALRVAEEDNVATVFHNGVLAGSAVTVVDRRGGKTTLRANSAIPYGHKVALTPLRPGDPVVKYGEVIGAASRDVAVGDHVHVQNLDSLRGRGDL